MFTKFLIYIEAALDRIGFGAALDRIRATSRQHWIGSRQHWIGSGRHRGSTGSDQGDIEADREMQQDFKNGLKRAKTRAESGLKRFRQESNPNQITREASI